MFDKVRKRWRGRYKGRLFGFVAWKGIFIVLCTGLALWMHQAACGEFKLSAGAGPRQESGATPDVRGALPKATQARTIKYFMPQAGEVTLVWGVNGWAAVPESLRAAGSRVVDGVMRSPMRRESGSFVADINVPVGSSLDRGFLITRALDGRPVEVWIRHPNRAIIIVLSGLLMILVLTVALARGPYAPLAQWAIRIGSTRIKRIVLSLAGVNLFLVASTAVVSYLTRHGEIPESAWPFATYAGMQLNLGAENNLAAWYSSMLFFSVAILAVYCYIADYGGKASSAQRGPAAGWLLIAVIFALLSLDEMGSIHERIGVITSVVPGGEARGWVSVLKVPIALCGMLMILCCYLRLGPRSRALAFTITGTALFLVNPLLELGEFSILDSSRAISQRWLHDLYLAVEEGAELFGSLAWMTGLLVYLGAHPTSASADARRARKCELQLQRVLAAVPVLSMLGLVSVELFVRYTLPGDTGIPRDWFAAALALLTFVVWWIRDGGRVGSSTWACSARLILAAGLSAALGVSLPSYFPEGTLPVYLFLSFVAVQLFYSGWFALRDAWLPQLVIGAMLALILGIASIVDVDLFPLPIGLAYAVVLLALTFAPLGRQRGLET